MTGGEEPVHDLADAKLGGGTHPGFEARAGDAPGPVLQVVAVARVESDGDVEAAALGLADHRPDGHAASPVPEQNGDVGLLDRVDDPAFEVVGLVDRVIDLARGLGELGHDLAPLVLAPRFAEPRRDAADEEPDQLGEGIPPALPDLEVGIVLAALDLLGTQLQELVVGVLVAPRAALILGGDRLLPELFPVGGDDLRPVHLDQAGRGPGVGGIDRNGQVVRDGDRWRRQACPIHQRPHDDREGKVPGIGDLAAVVDPAELAELVAAVVESRPVHLHEVRRRRFLRRRALHGRKVGVQRLVGGTGREHDGPADSDEPSHLPDPARQPRRVRLSQLEGLIQPLIDIPNGSLRGPCRGTPSTHRRCRRGPAAGEPRRR